MGRYTCRLSMGDKPLAHMLGRVQLCVTPWREELGGLLCPWDSPGKNTGVGCHFLLQGVWRNMYYYHGGNLVAKSSLSNSVIW